MGNHSNKSLEAQGFLRQRIRGECGRAFVSVKEISYRERVMVTMSRRMVQLYREGMFIIVSQGLRGLALRPQQEGGRYEVSPREYDREGHKG
jgi:hypothetical protein